MTPFMAKTLKVGERVTFLDAGGPGVLGADDGTVVEVMPHGIVVAWACFADSSLPARPLAFEHCGQVERADSETALLWAAGLDR